MAFFRWVDIIKNCLCYLAGFIKWMDPRMSHSLLQLLLAQFWSSRMACCSVAVAQTLKVNVKVTWHVAKYGDPPILGISALDLTHPKCTHTWSIGQPFMLRRPGSSWGFGALRILKVKRALDIHSPHLQFLPARDSNSQPLDYESDSLTIRPRLPHDFLAWR